MQCRVYINQNLFVFTLFEQKLKVSLKTKLFHIQDLQNSYDTLKIMLIIHISNSNETLSKLLPHCF